MLLICGAADLSGNPVIEEDKYRIYVVAVSTKLLVLDCRSVTEEERAEAAVTSLDRVLRADDDETGAEAPKQRAVPKPAALAFGRAYHAPPASRGVAAKSWANMSACTRGTLLSDREGI